MTASYQDIDQFVKRLATRLGDPEPFRTNTQQAVERLGFHVVFRDDAGGDCDIDGSYHHATGQIVCAEAASPGRRRFTILHELAHGLGRTDDEFANWLFQFKGAGRLEEERVANAFAAEILLPAELVDTYIPAEGPMAFDVLQLAKASTASREAVCVRAASRLRAPGLVTLSQGQVVQFASTRGVPFGIRRGSDQGPTSFFARAPRIDHHRETGVRISFPSGNSSETLIADAYTADDGYTFAVLMEHSAPWQDLTPIADGPDGQEVDCDQCDRIRISFRRCPECGDPVCPEPGHTCPCTRKRESRKCAHCGMDLPSGAPPDALFCDLHS